MSNTHAETNKTTSTTPSDALPPSLRELLSIFAKELSQVSFPGVDHKVLIDLSAQVEEEAQRVEELRGQLDTAHQTLIEVKGRLQRAAEQGLAYARVYAASDAELATRLAEVNLGGEAPRRRKLEVAAAATDPGDGTTPIKIPAKRGRKPKSQQPAAGEEASSEETSSEETGS